MINISDIEKYSTIFEIGIRQAGFIRPIGLHLCPMTLIVDLKQPFSFHRNWRRCVKKSMDCGHVFEYVEKPTIHDAKEFVNLFDQLKVRKNLGFSLKEKQILKLLQGSFHLFFIRKGDKRIAGRIAYTHGEQVYDVYAANSNEAIHSGAAYRIQEGILQYFVRQGYSYFDYGRISPSADGMNDIYLSKSYSGGYPIAYNGEWFFCRSIFLTYMYSFFLHVIHKQRLY